MVGIRPQAQGTRARFVSNGVKNEKDPSLRVVKEILSLFKVLRHLEGTAVPFKRLLKGSVLNPQAFLRDPHICFQCLLM